MLIDLRPNYRLETKFLTDHVRPSFQVPAHHIPKFLFVGMETTFQIECRRWSPNFDIYTLNDPPVGHWDQVRLLEVHNQADMLLFSTMAMVYDGELFLELGKSWVSLFSVEEIAVPAPTSSRFQLM